MMADQLNDTSARLAPSARHTFNIRFFSICRTYPRASRRFRLYRVGSAFHRVIIASWMRSFCMCGSFVIRRALNRTPRSKIGHARSNASRLSPVLHARASPMCPVTAPTND